MGRRTRAPALGPHAPPGDAVPSAVTLACPCCMGCEEETAGPSSSAAAPRFEFPPWWEAKIGPLHQMKCHETFSAMATSGTATIRTSNSVLSLSRKPSAFLPMAMSFIALAWVLGSISMYGVVHEADEGASTHLATAHGRVVADISILRAPGGSAVRHGKHCLYQRCKSQPLSLCSECISLSFAPNWLDFSLTRIAWSQDARAADSWPRPIPEVRRAAHEANP